MQLPIRELRHRMACFGGALPVDAIESARCFGVLIEGVSPVPRLRRAAAVRERQFSSEPRPIRVIDEISRYAGFAADVD